MRRLGSQSSSHNRLVDQDVFDKDISLQLARIFGQPPSVESNVNGPAFDLPTQPRHDRRGGLEVNAKQLDSETPTARPGWQLQVYGTDIAYRTNGIVTFDNNRA